MIRSRYLSAAAAAALALTSLAACGGTSSPDDDDSDGAPDAGADEADPDAGSDPTPDAAAPPGALAFASASTDLGGALVGTRGASATMALRNTGAGAIAGVDLALSGGDFAIQGHTCGGTIAAGAECAVTVAVTPTAAGARTATLTATASADRSVTAAATLTATGLTPGALAIAPATAELPRTRIGAMPGVYTFTVHNTGTAPLPAIATATGDGTAFSVTGSTCAAGLPGGGSCEVQVAFAPTTGGAHAGALSVSAGAVGATAAVTGRGFGIVEVRRTGDGAASGTVRGGDIDCGARCRVEVEAPTIRLTASAPERAARHLGWSATGCSGASCDVAVRTGETVVEARFGRVLQQAVRAEGSGFGDWRFDGAGCTILPDLSAYLCLAGTTVTLTAVATPGHTADDANRFDRWAGCDRVSGSRGEVCTTTLTTDRSAVATFVRQWKVTANLSQCRGAGIACEVVEQNGPSDGIDTRAGRDARFVDQGTSIVLRALENVDQNSAFTIWARGCNHQNIDCAVNVGAAAVAPQPLFRREYRLTLRAVRIPAARTVSSFTVSSDPNEPCRALECEYRFPSPTDVTIRGNSVSVCGFFRGFSGGGCAGMGACTVRMDRRRIVEGRFEQQPACTDPDPR